MANVVGPKGHAVIPKAIRARLGVKPGWQALQLVVGDHLEIYFVPPPHNRSLVGCLAPYLKRRSVEGDEEEWDAVIGRAIAREFGDTSTDDG